MTALGRLQPEASGRSRPKAGSEGQKLAYGLVIGACVGLLGAVVRAFESRFTRGAGAAGVVAQ